LYCHRLLGRIDGDPRPLDGDGINEFDIGADERAAR
jgi:hypothetical protein